MVEDAKEIVLEPTQRGVRIIAKGIGFSTLFLGKIVKIGDIIKPHTETEIEDITNKYYEGKEVDDILNSSKIPNHDKDWYDLKTLMGEDTLSRNMGGGILHKVDRIPFKVVKTEPEGEVKIIGTTNIIFKENISENAIFVKKGPNLKNLHEVKDRGEWIKVCGKFIVGAYQEKDGKTLYFSNMFYFRE